MIKGPSTLEVPSTSRIVYQRFLRFLRIGSFLHLMGMVGIALGISFSQYGWSLLAEGSVFWAWVSFVTAFCFFTVPIFSEFDALGRYQNYKQIKDAFHQSGYDKRLIKPFMYSKCQRDAVIVAGEDLGYGDRVKADFYDFGYRWYHILPDAFIKYPLVLFSGLFWKNILFTKHYELQNFYW